jgi:hypothetical protein
MTRFAPLVLIAVVGCTNATQNEPATPASCTACSLESRTTVAAVAGGLAVAGAGIGAGFGLAALNDKSNFDKHPTVNEGNAGNDNAVYSDVAFGAAVILGVTSVVLLVTNHDAPQDSADVATPQAAKSSKDAAAVTISATPIVLPHGGGAGALLRF